MNEFSNEREMILGNLRFELGFVHIRSDRAAFKQIVQRYRDRFSDEQMNEEVRDMIEHELADLALQIADILGNGQLSKEAANIVRNSGSYDKGLVRDLLEKYKN